MGNAFDSALAPQVTEDDLRVRSDKLATTTSMIHRDDVKGRIVVPARRLSTEEWMDEQKYEYAACSRYLGRWHLSPGGHPATYTPCRRCGAPIEAHHTQDVNRG